jgi:hypothetical protein
VTLLTKDFSSSPPSCSIFTFEPCGLIVEGLDEKEAPCAHSSISVVLPFARWSGDSFSRTLDVNADVLTVVSDIHTEGSIRGRLLRSYDMPLVTVLGVRSTGVEGT